MKVLIVHAWLRGNLGDVLQGWVLLRWLRDLGPTSLDLAGYPAVPGEEASELATLVDRYVPEPFNWYWRYSPPPVRAMLIEPLWRRRRRELFAKYDAIVSAPGAFLAGNDLRLPSALCDLEVAADLGVPFILANHSIGPLAGDSLQRIARTTLRVAREEITHEYLAAQGISSVESADLAFMFPYERALARAHKMPRPLGRYRLLFLRSRNQPISSVEWIDGCLHLGSRRIPLDAGERLVLASSDGHRDGRFMNKLSRRLGVAAVTCRSAPELVALVAGSSGVVTDRYHPAVCAAAFGKSVEILPNREPHKMLGLQGLLKRHDIAGLRGLARAGLDAVRSTLLGGPRIHLV